MTDEADQDGWSDQPRRGRTTVRPGRGATLRPGGRAPSRRTDGRTATGRGNPSQQIAAGRATRTPRRGLLRRRRRRTSTARRTPTSGLPTRSRHRCCSADQPTAPVDKIEGFDGPPPQYEGGGAPPYDSPPDMFDYPDAQEAGMDGPAPHQRAEYPAPPPAWEDGGWEQPTQPAGWDQGPAGPPGWEPAPNRVCRGGSLAVRPAGTSLLLGTSPEHGPARRVLAPTTRPAEVLVVPLRPTRGRHGLISPALHNPPMLPRPGRRIRRATVRADRLCKLASRAARQADAPPTFPGRRPRRLVPPK